MNLPNLSLPYSLPIQRRHDAPNADVCASVTSLFAHEIESVDHGTDPTKDRADDQHLREHLGQVDSPIAEIDHVRARSGHEGQLSYHNGKAPSRARFPDFLHVSFLKMPVFPGDSSTESHNFEFRSARSPQSPDRKSTRLNSRH